MSSTYIVYARQGDDKGHILRVYASEESDINYPWFEVEMPKNIDVDCMAWRLVTPGKIEAIMRHRAETGCSVVEAKEYVDRVHTEMTMQPTRGYCGLAGKP